MLDPTVNLSAVISIGSSFVLAVGFIWAIKSSVKVLDTRMTFQDASIAAIQQELKTLNRVVTDLAVHNQRMVTIEERQLAQGTRLDHTIARVDRWIDTKVGVG